MHILCFYIPQLHLALLTAQQDLIKVCAGMHQTGDVEVFSIKFHLKVQFYKNNVRKMDSIKEELRISLIKDKSPCFS